MTIIDIIKSGDVNEIKKLFKRTTFLYDQATAIKEFKVDEHDIFDASVRKMKTIKKGSGEQDANGKEKTTTESVDVARIGLSFQELIVDRRVGFMLSVPVETQAVYEDDQETESGKKLVKLVQGIQSENKMDYLNKEIARRMMSEMECAEVWYLVPSGKAKPQFTLKCKILSPELGDTLYPMFNAYGSMIAFAREYSLIEADKKISHYDVYLPEAEYRYALRDGAWSLDTLVDGEGNAIPNPIPNQVEKIMVVYHTQPKPEWANQASMIERLETSVSNHADMNDYFGSPILTVMGEIMGFASKGEQGKILELHEEAKAAFLNLDSPPESIKMEQENLRNYIHSLSQTPDISFSNLMNIGAISGIALKLMFLDAHLAVSKKEEIFGIGLQRRLNIIKAAIGKVIDTSLSTEAEKLQLIPKITPYLPLNETELLSNLTIAKTSGILSAETAVELNPYVEDAEVEMERLKEAEEREIADLTGARPGEKTEEE
jgi:SPP1 family phage portal protein